MTDAIREDAQQEEGKVTDLNDPNARYTRDEAMKAMAARRRETVQNDMDPEALAEYNGEPETAPLEVDPEKQLEAQTRVLTDEDLAQTRVKMKVNGEEREVSIAEMRAIAQKTDAADKFLADAKRLQAEMQAQQDAWNRAHQQVQQQAAPVTPATPPADVVEKVRGAVKSGVEKMFAGDDAGAVDGLVEAVMSALPPATAQAPAIDVKEIARQVTQQVTIQGALRQFATDFADVMDDTERANYADRQLYIAAGGQPLEALPPERVNAVLQEAGRMTRFKFGLAEPKATVPATTSREDKAARKARIDELPAASTRSVSTVPQPQTTADVISRMKTARGQVFRDPTQR